MSLCIYTLLYVITYNKVTREMREDTTLSKSTYILAQLLNEVVR
uniref:Uncharacterized protein n=1 Tax=Picea glauca TaxID=3330 RepID=A0A101M4N4_PICGL|nr:hypothetical protein ABT39_MTgene862 [Picea glauca]